MWHTQYCSYLNVGHAWRPQKPPGHNLKALLIHTGKLEAPSRYVWEAFWKAWTLCRFIISSNTVLWFSFYWRDLTFSQNEAFLWLLPCCRLQCYPKDNSKSWRTLKNSVLCGVGVLTKVKEPVEITPLCVSRRAILWIQPPKLLCLDLGYILVMKDVHKWIRIIIINS